MGLKSVLRPFSISPVGKAANITLPALALCLARMQAGAKRYRRPLRLRRTGRGLKERASARDVLILAGTAIPLPVHLQSVRFAVAKAGHEWLAD
jgi:hypothetical protein